MTLQQLSPQYAASALAIHQRILQLSDQLFLTDDPEEMRSLHRRICDLRPMERQARELATLTARYYDRRYHPYDVYTL